MRKLAIAIALLALTACDRSPPSQEDKDRQSVGAQQAQYAKGQPVPSFDFSLERQILIELYTARNAHAITHSVVRSETGVVEFDCPSLSFGLPYDTSLTNPLQAQWRTRSGGAISGVGIGQPEPNGVYASTNTSATWISCVNEQGSFTPVYTEGKVTVFPFPVLVDYTTGRVTPNGEATVTIQVAK